MTGRIAIVEDDHTLRDQLRRGLERDGFSVTAVATAAELLEHVSEAPPDVVAIDIGLPDADGRDLCQALRAGGVDAPVLFLTARSALSDRLSGFHMGGDDYLVKPFAFDELVVRLRALIRRSPNGDGAIDVGDLRLDPATHTMRTAGGEVELTPTEFRILASLAARSGGVVRRADLRLAAWPSGAIVHDNTLDSYIARLRRKLGAVDGTSIVTVHGVGYRLQ
jgi:two-component system, OmpR family, response regulator